jgi:ribosomal protein L32
MSQARRRAKAIARQQRVEAHRRKNSRNLGVCPNCGERSTGHFVPPSLGEPGFYICKEQA